MFLFPIVDSNFPVETTSAAILAASFHASSSLAMTVPSFMIVLGAMTWYWPGEYWPEEVLGFGAFLLNHHHENWLLAKQTPGILLTSPPALFQMMLMIAIRPSCPWFRASE